jgi:hypothetical protein
VAFKISPKFKAGDIKSKSLDLAFLPKYYKAVQKTLVAKTSVDTPTDFFFCQDFAAGEPLMIFGKTTAEHKKIFKDAGKGKDGFDKSQIAIGSCFLLEEENKRILCIQPNTTLGKAKEKESVKIINKMRRKYFKQFHDVRWLKAPLISNADGSVEQVNSDTDTNTEQTNTDTGTSTTDSTASSGRAQNESTQAGTGTSSSGAMVPRSDIEKKAKLLKRGIDKLQNDLMPRYKKQETVPNDLDFVKEMRKAGLVFLTKLSQTDEKTKEEFASNKTFLDNALPEWKRLEKLLGSRKDKRAARKEIKATLQKAVEEMNEIRREIKGLLKHVRFKKLS